MTTEQKDNESCNCKRGYFLCPTAEYLWARVGMAHNMRDYAEYDAWRARYEEHMSAVATQEVTK